MPRRPSLFHGQSPASRRSAPVAVLAVVVLLPSLALAALSGLPKIDVISTGAPAYTLTFTAAKSETVDVLLQDDSTVPGVVLSPLAALNLAVTSAGVIVPSAAGASTPATLSAPGTVAVPVTAGHVYEVRVVGVPTAGAANGNAVLVQVAPQSGGSVYKAVTTSFVDPSAAPVTQPAYEAATTP